MLKEKKTAGLERGWENSGGWVKSEQNRKLDKGQKQT